MQLRHMPEQTRSVPRVMSVDNVTRNASCWLLTTMQFANSVKYTGYSQIRRRASSSLPKDDSSNAVAT